MAINSSTGPLQPGSNSSYPISGKNVAKNAKATASTDSRAVSSSSSVSDTQSTQASQASNSTPNNATQGVKHSPNAVASAVALSVKAMKNEDFQQSQVQYDAPEGKSRKALQQYFDVMSQAKREELEQMLGVDMYV